MVPPSGTRTIPTPDGLVSDRLVGRPAVAGVLVASGTLLALGAVALGPAAAIALLAVPLILRGVVFALMRPAVAAVLMVVAELTNLSGLLEGMTPVPLFRTSLAFGLVAVALGLRHSQGRARCRSAIVLPAGLVFAFLVSQLVAVLSSVDVAVSIATLERYAVDLAFMLVLVLLVTLCDRPWVIAAALVVPLALLSILGVLNELFLHGAATFGGLDTVTQASGELVTTRRHGGPLPDSNFWGRHLVMGLPLALALTVRAFRAGRRGDGWRWVASAAALLAGIYLTQSRGTFLACAVAVGLWVLASGPQIRRHALKFLPLLVPLLLLPGIGNRLLALIRDVASGSVTYGIDPSILGRTAAQEIAWAMFRDRPLFGFGPGTYTSLVPHYAGRVSTAVLQPTDAPHNLYAQMASESGVVGLSGWLTMFGGLTVMSAVAVTRLRHRRREDRMLAAAVLAGLVAYAVASVFLHLSYLRSLDVLFALAVAVLSSSGPALPRASARVLRVNAAEVGSCVVAGVVASLVALWLFGRPVVTASQQLTVLSLLPVSGSQAYALDIRSRDSLLPTYAELMAEGRDRDLSAVADPVRGLITVSVGGGDEREAVQKLAAAVDAARLRLQESGAGAGYALNPVGVPELASSRRRSPALVISAVMLGVAVAEACNLFRRRRRRTSLPSGRFPVAGPSTQSSVGPSVEESL